MGSDEDIQSRQNGHQGFPQSSHSSSFSGSQNVISSRGKLRRHLRQDSISMVPPMLVPPGGFEPPMSGSASLRPIQLGHGGILVFGTPARSRTWSATFEASYASPTPLGHGTPGGIRTPNRPVRSREPYPVRPRAHGTPRRIRTSNVQLRRLVGYPVTLSGRKDWYPWQDSNLHWPV
jgi:hypothetical protein